MGPGGPAAESPPGDAGLQAAPAAGGHAGLGTPLLAVPGLCHTTLRILQVLRDQQRLAEEQREALEHRHRALLQEVLQDAVEVAEHNQHLRDTRRAGTADATTQTP